MNIKPLKWTDPQPANSEISYSHVISETPFGRIVITWKGWKEYASYDIEEVPWNSYSTNDIWYNCGADLEHAKQLAEEEYKNRLSQCFEGGNYGNNSGK